MSSGENTIDKIKIAGKQYRENIEELKFTTDNITIQNNLAELIELEDKNGKRVIKTNKVPSLKSLSIQNFVKLPLIVNGDNYFAWLEYVKTNCPKETNIQKTFLDICEKSYETLDKLRKVDVSRLKRLEETFEFRRKFIGFFIPNNITVAEWKEKDFSLAIKYEKYNQKDLWNTWIPSSFCAYISRILSSIISNFDSSQTDLSDNKVYIRFKHYAYYFRILSKAGEKKKCERITKLLRGESKSIFGTDYSMKDNFDETQCDTKFKWNIFSKYRCRRLVRTRKQMDDTFDENCNFKFDSSPSNTKTGGKTKKQNMKKSQIRKTKQQRGGEIKNYAYTLFAMGVVFLFIGATSFPPLLFLAFILFYLAVILYCFSMSGSSQIFCFWMVF